MRRVWSHTRPNLRCEPGHRVTVNPRGSWAGPAIDLPRVKWFTDAVTATWEQMQAELPRLLDLVQQGEEVVITKQGRVVARLTGVSQMQAPRDRRAWLTRLAQLRESTATGKSGPSTEAILDDLRSERG